MAERRTERTRRTRAAALSSGLIIGVLAIVIPRGAMAQEDQPCGTDDGTGCAPQEARVDLAAPTFSDPTRFTNVLHPSDDLRSGVMLGLAEGEPFRVEITLLPTVKVIELDGTSVPALESQYVAFVDGRIQEVALDWFAQADDGSVWYLGEDVFNYEGGVVADTEGTWQAGRDAPPAMIMPADPQVGDVYRPENAPGVVFEEVTVTGVGLDVEGPSGPVAGAIEVDELHMDGGHERKLFAPGYGEFLTGSGDDLEALALAVPTDAIDGPVPAELSAIRQHAKAIGEAAGIGDWRAASAARGAVVSSWDAYRESGVPPLLETATAEAIDVLSATLVGDDSQPRQAGAVVTAAIAVSRLGLDLELRYRDPASIDIDRLALWLDQLAVDLKGDDDAAMLSDVTAMEWTFDRFASSIAEPGVVAIDDGLARLRKSVEDGDVAAAEETAVDLQQLLVGLTTG